MKGIKATIAVLIASMLAFSGLFAVIAANGQSGQGTMDQDRVRIQDPAVCDNCDQNKTQDQDRIMDMNRTQQQLKDGSGDGFQLQNQGETVSGQAGEQLQAQAGGQPNLIMAGLQKAQNMQQLTVMMQQRAIEMNMQAQNYSRAERNVYQNQNQARIAVFGLQAMEGMMPGIGPQVSAYTKVMNQSVNQTLQLERKIQARSWVRTFFMGGDREAAAQLQQQVQINNTYINKIRQLSNECANCTVEVKAMLQSQLREMEMEQIRLQNLAEKGQNRRGLLSW